MANLMAAQNWSCPCTDQSNCIGPERISVLELYEHRKKFLTTCKSRGGKRDAWASDMKEHYHAGSKSFSRSFVVGPCNDCCVASAALAKGLSFQTHSSAHADVRKNRNLTKGGRKQAQKQKMTYSRTVMDAYIRRLRGSFEGSKSKQVEAWFTGKRSLAKRWQDFKKERTTNGLPMVGSEKIFAERWRMHTEIIEQGAKGHPVCDECGKTQVVYDRLEGRTDEAAKQARAKADALQAEHDREHRGEREYAEDIWDKAELRPDKVTAQNFDAPTVSQFDIPVQKRAARDVAKRLESMQKWGSKVTGVMTSGLGMLCFFARAGLGSGPNLSLTILYLSLLKVSDDQGFLGSRYNILMDNTGGDNKNAEMLLFLGFLVHMDYFDDASFFCQLKGHTFTILDQSFNTLISQLLAQCIYTVSALIQFTFQFLQPYGCREVIELHQLWDWKAVFKDANLARISGFCTGQYGSGMHEAYVRKDEKGGPATLHSRKSCTHPTHAHARR